MRARLKVSRAGVELIKSFEGLRSTAARLPDGRWTLGYGHTFSAREGATCTQEDADALLRFDLLPVVDAINNLVLAPLNQNQFDALVSFCFNIGVDNFAQSTVLKRVNEGRMTEAALAMDAWRSAEFNGQTYVLAPLIRRRAAEKNLFLTPEDVTGNAPSLLVRPIEDAADAAPSIPAELDAPDRNGILSARPLGDVQAPVVTPPSFDISALPQPLPPVPERQVIDLAAFAPRPPETAPQTPATPVTANVPPAPQFHDIPVEAVPTPYTYDTTPAMSPEIQAAIARAQEEERLEAQRQHDLRIEELRRQEQQMVEQRMREEAIRQAEMLAAARAVEEARQREEARLREEARQQELQRLEALRLEQLRLDEARLEQERQERERALRDEMVRAELARLEHARLEQQERERQEAAQRDAARLEALRLDAERVEAARLEALRAEAERAEAARLEQERAREAQRRQEELRQEELRQEELRQEEFRKEQQRLEDERRERERQEQQRLEDERRERERQEQARLEAERVEAERREREQAEADRLARERAEQERAAKERADRERAEAEKARAEAAPPVASNPAAASADDAEKARKAEAAAALMRLYSPYGGGGLGRPLTPLQPRPANPQPQPQNQAPTPPSNPSQLASRPEPAGRVMPEPKPEPAPAPSATPKADPEPESQPVPSPVSFALKPMPSASSMPAPQITALNPYARPAAKTEEAVVEVPRPKPVDLSAEPPAPKVEPAPKTDNLNWREQLQRPLPPGYQAPQATSSPDVQPPAQSAQAAHMSDAFDDTFGTDGDWTNGDGRIAVTVDETSEDDTSWWKMIRSTFWWILSSALGLGCLGFAAATAYRARYDPNVARMLGSEANLTMISILAAAAGILFVCISVWLIMKRLGGLKD